MLDETDSEVDWHRLFHSPF